MSYLTHLDRSVMQGFKNATIRKARKVMLSHDITHLLSFTGFYTQQNEIQLYISIQKIVEEHKQGNKWEVEIKIAEHQEWKLKNRSYLFYFMLKWIMYTSISTENNTLTKKKKKKIISPLTLSDSIFIHHASYLKPLWWWSQML